MVVTSHFPKEMRKKKKTYEPHQKEEKGKKLNSQKEEKEWCIWTGFQNKIQGNFFQLFSQWPHFSQSIYFLIRKLSSLSYFLMKFHDMLCIFFFSLSNTSRLNCLTDEDS